MKDDGYTLVEVLAALVMIALAVSGLIAGVEVLSRQQSAAGAARFDPAPPATSDRNISRVRPPAQNPISAETDPA